LTLLVGKLLMTAASGLLKRTWTVRGSGVVMAFFFARAHCGAHVHTDPTSRWKFQATASASSGVPSENFRPSRSLIVRVLPSSLMS
jgi:hypothetical protein